MENRWKQWQTLFSWAPKSLQMVTTATKLKDACLLLGRKAMTNLDSILKSRDITLSTKVHLVKAMIFPVVMFGRESWTIRKAERWKIDAFELWCWGRLLRSGTGGEGDDRGWDGWMASRTRWMWVWVNSGRWWWTGRPVMLRFMGSQRVGHDRATELNWTDKDQKKMPNQEIQIYWWISMSDTSPVHLLVVKAVTPLRARIIPCLSPCLSEHLESCLVLSKCSLTLGELIYQDHQ